MNATCASLFRQNIRSIFLSDLHLGSRYCRPDAITRLLSKLHTDHLYLVGDILDGWMLCERLHWPEACDSFLNLIRQLSNRGTKITYLLGNHDRFLCEFIAERTQVEVMESAVHHCADGRRLLIIHGDLFDLSQARFQRSSRIAAGIHERLLGGSQVINGLLDRMGLQPRRFGTLLTEPIKHLVQSYSRHNERLALAVQHWRCDGLVSGHTHSPRLDLQGSMVLANTGDWLEHCSLLVETHSGQLELWEGTENAWSRMQPRRLGLLPANYGLERPRGSDGSANSEIEHSDATQFDLSKSV